MSNTSNIQMLREVIHNASNMAGTSAGNDVKYLAQAIAKIAAAVIELAQDVDQARVVPGSAEG
jgi:outer membrane murein-binding lipoprotein Lpp